MAITPDQDIDVEYVSREEGIALFERQVRRELGISGDEFIRRYQSGELDDLDPSKVIHLSILLPFAGYSLDGRKNPQ